MMACLAMFMQLARSVIFRKSEVYSQRMHRLDMKESGLLPGPVPSEVPPQFQPGAHAPVPGPGFRRGGGIPGRFGPQDEPFWTEARRKQLDDMVRQSPMIVPGPGGAARGLIRFLEGLLHGV